MKRIFILLITFILMVAKALAQQPPLQAPRPEDANKMANIQGLKIAYFTKQLALTVEDAQKFWPNYFALDDELHNIKKQNCDNILLQDEKILAIKKRYYNEFKKILGSDERANKVFVAERGFGNEVKKVLFERHKMFDMRQQQQPFGDKRPDNDMKRPNEKTDK